MNRRLVALALVMALPAPPAAASCLDDVHALAEGSGLSSKPPVVAPDSKDNPGVTSRQLSRSGGVVTPPPTADNSVIKPPGNTDPGMQTMPQAKPAPSPASSSPGQGAKAEAGAERAALQAALTAARAAAERGDEQACRDGLGKARDLAEKN